MAHCMLVKEADIYTRESQNLWEFCPKLEISFQSRRCRLFSLTITSLDITSLTLTLLYILTSANSKFDLEMRESLLISKLKPILINNNISSMPLNLF